MRFHLFCLAAFLTATGARAGDDFSRLVNKLPRSANAIVLLNVDKAMESPLGKFEGWQDDLEKAYAAGLTCVPPQAERFVLAAEIDFEYLKPLWEAAIGDVREKISIADIAKNRNGQTDVVESLSAVVLPEDVYLLQFDEKTLAGIGPANRKLVVNWLRDIKAGLKLSPYLVKAASYSDTAGSEVIVAVDLDGAFSTERIVEYLKKKPAVAQGDVNLQKAARFLTSVQGIRLGIRLAQPPSAAVAIDCGTKPDLDPQLAKDAILQVLGDTGLLLEDMRDWQCKVKDDEVSLSGKLSKSGLRRVLSLVDSPTSSQTTSVHASKPTKNATSTDPKLQMAEATKRHFHEVTNMFDDLKGEMKDAANLAVTATYFDRYAKRMERLPILDVDEAMLDYSSYVASSLRQAAGAVRTMGIRGGARQKQITSSDAGYGYAYGYRSGWGGAASWAVPTYDPVAEARGIDSERRKVRAEEKGVAATDVHKIRADVIDATSKIRRSMTEKYQIEF